MSHLEKSLKSTPKQKKTTEDFPVPVLNLDFHHQKQKILRILKLKF